MAAAAPGAETAAPHSALDLPPAGPAPWHLWTPRLGALVTDDGCNGEDHSAASGADRDREGTAQDRKNWTGTEWWLQREVTLGQSQRHSRRPRR